MSYLQVPSSWEQGTNCPSAVKYKIPTAQTWETPSQRSCMAQSNILPVAGWLCWLKSQVLGRWGSSETALKKHSNSTRRWTKGSLPPKSPLHVLCLHSSHQQFMLADLWSCLRFMAGKQSMEAPEESISSCPWAKSCPYQQALSQVLGCRELIWGQLLFVTPSNKSLVCSCANPAELPELLGVHPRERIHSCQGLECFPCSLTCPWSLKPYKSLWFCWGFFFSLLLSFASVVKQEKGRGLQDRGESV